MNEVTTTTENAPALPVDLDALFLADSGAGLENVSAGDLKLAYIQILQSTSPQLKPSHAKYIKGATQGQLVNSVTGELYDVLDFVPSGFHKEVVEWAPRDSGRKGIINRFEFNSPNSEGHKALAKAAKNEKGVLINGDGNELRETYLFPGLLLKPNGGSEYAVISGTSTNIKHCKALLSLLTQSTVQTPSGEKVLPLYANVVSVLTQGESNAKGDYSVFKFMLSGTVKNAAIYMKAKDFATVVKTTKIAVEEEDLDSPAPTNSGQGGGFTSTDDVPF
jgi:hypothetical protein